ncbi:MAG: LacI family DNA-binding transcriptional regulator [Planctomycetaceae bacterium]|nr:LacI family DNA-binding transcriptional regulator [Planctomycetaceae bacterium]
MRPTIKTIADLVGVSRGTVDRVLNNRPNVKPDKQQKVLDAIRTLNYKPNMAARALAMNNRKVRLGVLYPLWEGHFTEEISRGIADAQTDMRLYGVEIVTRQVAGTLPDDFLAGLDWILGHEVAGLALCAVNSIAVVERLRDITRAGTPVVTFNSDIADCGRACFVGQDRYKSGRIAAELLAKLVDAGEPVLVAAGNLEFNGHKDRARGFCDRWAELGRGDIYGNILQTYNDFDLTYGKIADALAARPEVRGIYMGNESAPACVEAIRRSGLRHRVKVVTHDLSPAHIRLLRTGEIDFIIEQNMYYQGYRPVEILTNLLVGGTPVQEEMEHTRISIVTAENIEQP